MRIHSTHVGSIEDAHVRNVTSLALLFITFLTILALIWITSAVVYAFTCIIASSNPAIVYSGRWDTRQQGTVTSYWGGSYFKTDFTGQTLQLKLAKATSLDASIDNSAMIAYPNVSGIVNLTPTALHPGLHTLCVTTGNEWSTIALQDILLDRGATLKAPLVAPQSIEFIGDSITVGYLTTHETIDSYAWLTGEQLHVEHTQIATSGITLLDYNNTQTGMESQYFKLQTLRYPNSPNWNFTRFQPTAVVINLGTNDYHHHVSAALFQQHYTTFLEHLRHVYPQAYIFALRTFLGYEAAPTLAAVQSVSRSGDHNVYYLNTTGWITAGTSDYSDALHPSNLGHQKITRHLVPLLSTFLHAATMKHQGAIHN